MARPLPEEVQNLYVVKRHEQITITSFDAFTVFGFFILVILAFISAGV